jgi:hypothetical protein
VPRYSGLVGDSESFCHRMVREKKHFRTGKIVYIISILQCLW